LGLVRWSNSCLAWPAKNRSPAASQISAGQAIFSAIPSRRW
jgi:hypothetical protein